MIQAEGTGAGPSAGDGATVLVVDDDIDLAETFAIWLRDQYEVRVAHRGDDAIEAYSAEVDIVLLDRRLPKTSGDDVLGALRKQEGESLVAMVSAVEPSTDLADLPVDDYIVKPVQREELRTLVGRLRKRQRYDETIKKAASRVSRANTIETHTDPETLAASAAFDELTAGIDDLRELAAESDACDPAMAIEKATDGDPEGFGN